MEEPWDRLPYLGEHFKMLMFLRYFSRWKINLSLKRRLWY
jgi:hypothetical protein